MEQSWGNYYSLRHLFSGGFHIRNAAGEIRKKSERRNATDVSRGDCGKRPPSRPTEVSDRRIALTSSVRLDDDAILMTMCIADRSCGPQVSGDIQLSTIRCEPSDLRPRRTPQRTTIVSCRYAANYRSSARRTRRLRLRFGRSVSGRSDRCQ